MLARKPQTRAPSPPPSHSTQATKERPLVLGAFGLRVLRPAGVCRLTTTHQAPCPKTPLQICTKSLGRCRLDGHQSAGTQRACANLEALVRFETRHSRKATGSLRAAAKHSCSDRKISDGRALQRAPAGAEAEGLVDAERGQASQICGVWCVSIPVVESAWLEAPVHPAAPLYSA